MQIPNADTAACKSAEPVLAQPQVEVGPEVVRASVQAQPELLGGGFQSSRAEHGPAQVVVVIRGARGGFGLRGR